MHSLVFKAISEAIPHAITTVFDWFKNDPIKLSPERKQEIRDGITAQAAAHAAKTRNKPLRKKRDCTKINGATFDMIVVEEEERALFNLTRDPGVPKVTQDILVINLNKKLGLDKSKTFYSNIWNGHVARPHDFKSNSE